MMIGGLMHHQVATTTLEKAKEGDENDQQLPTSLPATTDNAAVALTSDEVSLTLPRDICSTGNTVYTSDNCTNMTMISLMVPRHSILYMAFGTNLMLTETKLATFCQAFYTLLQEKNSKISYVIFTRKLAHRLQKLQQQHPDPLPGLCCGYRQHLSSSTQHTRILVYDWISQPSLLASDAIGVFLTHGGYASIQEAKANLVPTLVMGVFGDQPSHAASAQEMKGGGLFLDRTASSAMIVEKVQYMMQHRSKFVQQMLAEHQREDAYLSIQHRLTRTVDLLEYAVDHYDRLQQALVPRTWRHYSKSSYDELTSSEKMDHWMATMGAGWYLLVGWMIIFWIVRKVMVCGYYMMYNNRRKGTKLD